MDTAQLVKHNKAIDRGVGALELAAETIEQLHAESTAKDAEIADLKARLKVANFGLRYALVGCINEPAPIISEVAATDLSKHLKSD